VHTPQTRQPPKRDTHHNTNPIIFFFAYLHQFLIFCLETMDKYKEEEKNLLEALEYKKTHPHASFRWLEGQFKVKKDKINRRWLESQNPHQAHNQLLGPDQDKALVQYCFRLSDISVPLQHKFIRNIANQILQLAHGDKDGSPLTAGQNWPYK
jgi:hypothetical protein